MDAADGAVVARVALSSGAGTSWSRPKARPVPEGAKKIIIDQPPPKKPRRLQNVYNPDPDLKCRPHPECGFCNTVYVLPEDPLDAWHWQRLALNLLDNAFRDFNNRGYEYQSDYSPDPGVGDRFYDTETGRCGIVVEQAASIDGKSAEWLLRYDDEPCQVERRSDSYRRKSLWLNCCPYAPPAKGSVAKLVEK